MPAPGQLSFSVAQINSAIGNAARQLGTRSGYTVGCYLFPGWCTPNGGGPNPSDPWSLITPTPERIPVLGAYDETQQYINDWRFAVMADAGIDFVAIDWFMQWSGTTLLPMLDHVINRYKTCTGRKPKFCIQFANQTNAGGLTTNTWISCYTKWITDYFTDPNYYRVNNKPVVIMNSVPVFHDTSMLTHTAVKTALDAARAAAVTAGFDGIWFMGGHADSSSAWMDVTIPSVEGWDGVTGSNIFRTTKVSDNSQGPAPTTYADLDNAVFSGVVGGYRGFCNGWLNAANVGPLWIPCTAGFQKVDGWNGGVPTTLLGQSTLAQFYQHLSKAKALIDANPFAKTQNTIMIEAWNEFGEGSFIEPTAKWGYDLVRAIRHVLAV